MTVCGLIACVAWPGHAQDQVEKDIILYSRQLLTGGTEYWRYEAAVELCKHGSRAKSAVPALAKALVDPSPRVREAAKRAIVCIGRVAVGGLVDSMRSTDPAVRARVAELLDHFGEHCGPYFRTILAMLADNEPAVRDRLADALGKLGEEALPQLLDALDAGRIEVRLAAGRALGRVGPAALPRLLAALNDPASPARDGAACGLGIMGAAAAVAAEPLLSAYRDESAPDGVRAEAARSLGSVLGEDAAGAAAAAGPLAQGLKSGSADVRAACMESLERIGAPALEALSAAALDPASQDAAIEVLVRLDKAGRGALEGMLRENTALARAALAALTGHGSGPVGEAEKAARRMLIADDAACRLLAIQVLTRGALWLDDEVETRLIALLADPDRACREAAARGLGNASPGDAVVDALRKACGDADPRVRAAAGLSCWLLAIDVDASLQVIGEALAAPDPSARRAAAEALAAVGGAAERYADGLIAETAGDRPPELRRAATRALAEIARFGGSVRQRAAAWRKTSSSSRAARGIAGALRWLAAHQDTAKSGIGGADGKWSCDRFGLHDPKSAGDDTGRAEYTPGVTGLVLQAFLGIGHTDRGKDNPFAANVREGLTYLLNAQASDGSISPASARHFLSNHAIATIALAEAWILTCDPKYRIATRKAVEFIVAIRGVHAWGYERLSARPNMETTTWCVTALRVAQLGGIDVGADALDRAGSWITSVTDAEGVAGYDRPGSGVFRPAELRASFPADESRATTAAACWCLYLIGGPRWESDACTKGQIAVNVHKGYEWNDDGEEYDLYFWHFGTLLMLQSYPEWRREWDDLIQKRILTRQATKGPAAGSWDPADVWGREGGRVYATAMSALTLEASHRFPAGFLTAASGPPRVTAVLKTLCRDADAEVARLARRAAQP